MLGSISINLNVRDIEKDFNNKELHIIQKEIDQDNGPGFLLIDPHV